MKSKRVRYSGCHLRSYLEYLWATRLDALGIRWSYEPSRFYFETLSYLPDFWLPDHGCFLEVKPIVPSLEEVFLAKLLHEHTQDPVYFLIGRPREALVWQVTTVRYQGRDRTTCRTFTPPWLPAPVVPFSRRLSNFGD